MQKQEVAKPWRQGLFGETKHRQGQPTALRLFRKAGGVDLLTFRESGKKLSEPHNPRRSCRHLMYAQVAECKPASALRTIRCNSEAQTSKC